MSTIIKGVIRKEVPDPEHANDSPNWFHVTAEIPHTFEGETEDDAFVKLRSWQAASYYGTTNGVVPHFKFEDEYQKERYYEWLKENPTPITSYSQTF